MTHFVSSDCRVCGMLQNGRHFLEASTKQQVPNALIINLHGRIFKCFNKQYYIITSYYFWRLQDKISRKSSVQVQASLIVSSREYSGVSRWTGPFLISNLHRTAQTITNLHWSPWFPMVNSSSSSSSSSSSIWMGFSMINLPFSWDFPLPKKRHGIGSLRPEGQRATRASCRSPRPSCCGHRCKSTGAARAGFGVTVGCAMMCWGAFKWHIYI